jgi:predicted DNA-binding transcriptional regulator YafY
MSSKMFTRRQALVAASGAAAAAAVGASPAAAEYQPAMQAALTALYNAKNALLMGTPDKGGHRVAAIALINQAITQVQLGIQYDNVH